MGPVKRLAAGAVAAIVAAATGVIAYHEGYVTHTYADPIGIPTVCYGHTGAGVVAGKEYTRAECDALLDSDVRQVLTSLQWCLAADLKPNEWAALVSLAYNTGAVAICRSTIARMINAGQPASEWCRQFARWIYAGGRVLPGLVKRRAHEQALCLGAA